MNIQFKHRPDKNRWEWYYSPQGSETGDVYNWCYQTFGWPGPGEDALWNYYSGWIYFYNEKWVTMFVLRWS